MRDRGRVWAAAITLLVVAAGPVSGQCEVRLTASDPEAHDNFGSSVALDGNVAVVGAFAGDDAGINSGAVYVYRFDGAAWSEEAKLTASDAGPGDKFGTAVAIDGDVIVIGAPADNAHAGSAYAFRYDGISWIEEAKLTGEIDLEPADQFGSVVDVSGDAIVVGAFWDNDACPDDPSGCDSGSAYIFRYNNGSGWFEEQKLTASDANWFDMFGVSVAIDGDVAVIGAHGDDDECNFCNTGSAYVFRFDGSSWIEETKFEPVDPEWGDYFGKKVAIDGAIVVVGVELDDDQAGSAYVYRYGGGGWDDGIQLTASDREPDDFFGTSLAISAGTIVIGTHGDNDLGLNSGSLYVYQFEGSTWNESKITISEGEEDHFFGSSSAISGDTVIAGLEHDDSAGTNTGSVYLFHGLDDCNDNGIWDRCELDPHVNETSAEMAPIGAGSPQSYTLYACPPAVDDVLLSFTAQADLSAPVEWIDVDVNGVMVGSVFEVGAVDCAEAPDEAELAIPPSLFNAAVAGAEDAVITMTPTADVNPSHCSGSSFIQLQVRYHGIGSGDEDANGVLDVCESTCPADVDGSGGVDVTDLIEVVLAWGAPDSPADVAPPGGDGMVDVQDLVAVILAWGPCP